MAASSSTSQVLRLMVGVQVTEEQLESITDRTVQEADEDGDGAVSFMEFSKVRMPLGPEEFLGQMDMGNEARRRRAEREGFPGGLGDGRGSWKNRGLEFRFS